MILKNLFIDCGFEIASGSKINKYMIAEQPELIEVNTCEVITIFTQKKIECFACCSAYVTYNRYI